MYKENMKKWLSGFLTTSEKKPFPILTFPAVTPLNLTVKEMLSSAKAQSEGMVWIANHTDSAAVIGFMDLSVEAECFGSTVRFSDDEVPTIVGEIIHDEDEAAALTVPEVGSKRTGTYIEAIKLTAEKVSDRPTFAGMIGPLSLAARLFGVSEIMITCYDDPDSVHVVLEKVTEFLINYAKAYKSVGANGIMIAEPVSGLLSPSLEAEFSAPYVKKIVDAVQDENYLVIYHNCGNNVTRMTDSLLTIGASAYHFGNAIDLKEMLDKFPKDIPVMGNIDPAGEFRMGTPESIGKATTELLNRLSAYPNFVLSSGCDIPPLSPWENIYAFYKAVKDFYCAKPEKDTLSLKAIKLGATDAQVISADKVVTDRSFRDVCAKNACGLYGKNWTCPPDAGDIDELMSSLKSYSSVLVFQTIGELEDSFDVENMLFYGQKHNELTLKIKELCKEEGILNPLVLGAGGCKTCEKCAKITNEPCRFPEKAVKSLESYGIYVAKLAEFAGMKYINGQNTVTYFGAVFFNVENK